MRPPAYLLRPAWLGLALALGAGCASSNVNPPQPRPHKGYVDFYCPGQSNLCWQVRVAPPGTEHYKTLFSRVKPLPGPVLRLELPPGVHQFEVSFWNRVIEEPLTQLVQVREGKVTPVRLEFVPISKTSIARREQEFGRNVRGAGRKTRYSTQAGATERLLATVQPPEPYRPEGHMDYSP